MDYGKIIKEGISLYNKGDYNSALIKYKTALKHATKFDLGAIYYNIGLCHFSKFNYKASEISFNKAFYEYSYSSCGYELSMSKLFNSELKEGLDLYHYRYHMNRNTFPNLPIPAIRDIDELKGKKVLVLNEQGFGDEIMFSRNILKLNEIAGSVNYQVYDKMFDLFNDNFIYDNIKYFTNRSLSYDFVMSHDCWINTGDLFASYTKKYGFDYLTIKSKYDSTNKIGLTWYANKESKNSEQRSLNLDIIKEALKDKEVVSLQHNDCPDWMSKVDINDFNKTADEISKLDYVITVDTVTAHLSAAMDKKTILIYDKYLDWRYNYKLYKNVILVNIDDLSYFLNNI